MKTLRKSKFVALFGILAVVLAFGMAGSAEAGCGGYGGYGYGGYTVTKTYHAPVVHHVYKPVVKYVAPAPVYVAPTYYTAPTYYAAPAFPYHW